MLLAHSVNCCAKARMLRITLGLVLDDRIYPALPAERAVGDRVPPACGLARAITSAPVVAQPI